MYLIFLFYIFLYYICEIVRSVSIIYIGRTNYIRFCVCVDPLCNRYILYILHTPHIHTQIYTTRPFWLYALNVYTLAIMSAILFSHKSLLHFTLTQSLVLQRHWVGVRYCALFVSDLCIHRYNIDIQVVTLVSVYVTINRIFTKRIIIIQKSYVVGILNYCIIICNIMLYERELINRLDGFVVTVDEFQLEAENSSILIIIKSSV